MVSTETVVSIAFGLSLLIMIWYLTNRGRANLAKAKSNSEPAEAPQLLDNILPVVNWSPTILVEPTLAFGCKYKASTE